MPKQISATFKKIARDVKFGKNVQIIGKKVCINPGVIIGNDVSIYSDEVHIGYKTVIQDRCDFAAIGGPAKIVKIGDFSFIGFDTKVLVPVFEIGDYTSIHNHVLVNGYKPCTLGHNCFVGQHSLLNAAEELRIGNNFRMALNGYVWTHAESGELLEGCNFYYRARTVIEDNVWLTGCNITISPGVRLGNGSIILMGSVVTKNTLPRHCYGGVPARDLTGKLRPYHKVSLKKKVEMMKRFVNEFIEINEGKYSNAFSFISRPDSKLNNPAAKIVIIESGLPKFIHKGISVFSISEKTYIKQRTEIEEKFMRFLVPARARFLPI